MAKAEGQGERRFSGLGHMKADPLVVPWWIPQRSLYLCTNHVFSSHSAPPPWMILSLN